MDQGVSFARKCHMGDAAARFTGEEQEIAGLDRLEGDGGSLEHLLRGIPG
jgi:hypothetical protein